jgi:hypothetical protein
MSSSHTVAEIVNATKIRDSAECSDGDVSKKPPREDDRAGRNAIRSFFGNWIA